MSGVGSGVAGTGTLTMARDGSETGPGSIGLFGRLGPAGGVASMGAGASGLLGVMTSVCGSWAQPLAATTTASMENARFIGQEYRASGALWQNFGIRPPPG